LEIRNAMSTEIKTIRIAPSEMRSRIFTVLKNLGFSEVRADKCAEIFTLNTVEGVYSHGINRFPRFVKNIKEGIVIPAAEPVLVSKSGGVEQWNGNLGPGPLNAVFGTERVMKIAEEYTIGMLAMANTNHWMRAGAYGWMAARKGFAFMCWTNTCKNMPAWGAKDPRLGNNPFVIAVPYRNEAIVMDMAMSQFSYGKMELLSSEGKKLPYPGGYNIHGELTDNPDEILRAWRPLPMGYWKGSGMSLMLDILAAILSGGQSTHQIKSCESEHAISQVFIAISLKNLHNFSKIDESVNSIIENLKESIPEDENSKIRYPGESVLKIREENLKNGIPVDSRVWGKIMEM
jgi:3-dehydro-L-gulonate 2-dehydrogenase